MFCYNCGEQINENQNFCQHCGSKVIHNDFGYQQPYNKQNTYQQYSQNNQYNGQAVQYYTTSTPVPAGSYMTHPFCNDSISDKERVPAAVLAFFLGGFGVHRFYAGKSGSAVAMLAMTLFGLLFSIVGVGLLFVFAAGIWGLVDFIIILCGDFKDANGRYIKKWA